ncbi:acetate/propionate family kinase [Mycoplasma iguanae]|uniref:Acetate kinase n=1 Tax=Mycoplasma iguanae TaxID=292461 RepID=A0ABY5R911_9MOLU|nr:acetate/propionate family kinase [Mycoplasma iguanae]UVD81928.1 acetate/propionate family kinase [Mycoplasma iguanae]
MEKILVINAGSSSMKWALFNKTDLNQIANGIAERIGIDGVLGLSFNNDKKEKQVNLKNHSDAVKEILIFWKENGVIKSIEEIELVGFRVVHGGKYFSEAIRIDQKAIELIDECSKFAPLHNPPAAAAIRAFGELLPNAKFSANFDTAFHATIPQVNNIYPINFELSEKHGIKKYGFHGTSHHFITKKLEEILQKDKVNFVNLHLGNGSSLCAIKDSKSLDTTMGFTPLAGVMMGTRSGDIDPSIHEFIMKEENLTVEEFTNILNKKSGLLGVSGVSSDMRDLIAEAKSGNQKAEFALDLFAKTIVDYLVSYINKIGPEVDAIVFTAGIGENSSSARKRIIEKLHFKNIKLDLSQNNLSPKDIGPYHLISTPDSEIPVYVIRTNEELMIAKDALKLSENK